MEYPKLAIFDCDGVITDTALLHYKAWKKLSKEIWNYELEEKYIDKFRGLSREKCLKIILNNQNLQYSKEEEKNFLIIKNNYYLELINNVNEVVVFQEIINIIRTLKTYNIKIALGSSSRNAQPLIKKLGLDIYFDYFVDPLKIKKPKPFPDIFLNACDQFKINPTDTIAFEDAKIGIEAINAAKIFSIGIGSVNELKESNILFKTHKDVLLNDIFKEFNRWKHS